MGENTTDFGEGWRTNFPVALPFVAFGSDDIRTEESEGSVLLDWLRESRAGRCNFLYHNERSDGLILEARMEHTLIAAGSATIRVLNAVGKAETWND